MGITERNISPIRAISSLIFAKDGVKVSSRGTLNLITGTGVTLTVVDNQGTGAIDATISAGGASFNHNILSVTHPDTLAAAVVRGDLIVGNSTPLWSRLAIGTTAKYLRSNGTDPSWQTVTAADIGSGANLSLGTSLQFTAGTGTGVLLAAATVNTIQGIRTVDTPQFLRIGIGVAADATAAIKGMISNSAKTPVQYLRDSSVGNNLRISANGTGTRYWSVGIDVDDSGYPATDILTLQETAVLINSNAAVMEASEIFEVRSSGNADPLVSFGNSAASDSISVKIRNASGSTRLFVSGGANQFVTGTVAGDVGYTGSLTKTFWFGHNTRVSQPVFTTGSPTAFRVDGAINTTLTASVEAIDINFNLNRTVQFATGNITAQEAFVIQQPAYAFVGASTITDAATVSIVGSPDAGLNATITRQHTLWLRGATAGSSRDTTLSIDGETFAGAKVILNESTGTNLVTVQFKENNSLKAHVLWTPDGYMELGADVNIPVNIVTNAVNRQTISGTGDVAFVNIGTVSIGASVTGFWRFWIEKAGTISIGYNNTAAAANNRLWYEAVTATQLSFGIENDAQSVVTDWLKVTRSGTTVSSVEFPSSSITLTNVGTHGTLYNDGSSVVQKVAHVADGSVYSSKGTTTAPAYRTLNSTTNQVTVTTNAGNFTFSTPQDIHTAATPQFARIGIGVAADATALGLFQKDQNNPTFITIKNATAGASSEAKLLLVSDTATDCRVSVFSSSSSLGAAASNSLYLYNDNAAGIAFLANNANGVIKLATGGTAVKLTLNKDGNLDAVGKVTTYLNITTTNNGVPSLVASSNLTAQGSAIGATTIYAVPAAGVGFYRVSWMATVTRAATTSCVLGGAAGFQIIFTDQNDSVVKTSNPTTITSSAVNATGTTISAVWCGYCKASTNLQYSFGYTSVGGTTMQYDLSIRVESIG